MYTNLFQKYTVNIPTNGYVTETSDITENSDDDYSELGFACRFVCVSLFPNVHPVGRGALFCYISLCHWCIQDLLTISLELWMFCFTGRPHEPWSPGSNWRGLFSQQLQAGFAQHDRTVEVCLRHVGYANRCRTDVLVSHVVKSRQSRSPPKHFNLRDAEDVFTFPRCRTTLCSVDYYWM